MPGIQKRKYSIFKEQWFFLVVVIILLSVVTSLSNENYLKINNLISIMEQISVLGVVAAGVTVLNISGNVDISLGANIGLSTCTMAFSIINGVPVGIAIPLGILVSILCSLFVGACSILFRAPAFIISLATIGIFQGIALAFTQGTLQTIYGEFEYIGATRIAGFLPLLFLISIVVYIIIHFILQKTKLGRRVFAIGNNKRAAYLSGIKIKTNIMVFFLISGLCCGVASMMLLSRVGGCAALHRFGN